MRTALIVTSLLLLPAAALAQSLGDPIVVKTENAQLKSGSDVTGTVPKGNVLTVKEVNGDWLWVIFSSGSGTIKGWIARSDVIPFDQALDFFSDDLRRKPTASAYSIRAMIWNAKGNHDKAITDYNAAIRLDPKRSDAWTNRGVAWANKAEYDKAIADYDEAIRLDPQSALACRNRGIAWGHKGEYDKAIADYNEAIRLDPEFGLAYRNRGIAWANKAEYDKAVDDYNEAIRLNPKDAGTLLVRATARLLMRDRSAAMSFQEVIDVDEGKSSNSLYAMILGILSSRLLRDGEQAPEFLDDSGGIMKTGWPHPCIAFLKGELDEAGLLELAIDSDKQTEARCYLGLNGLAHGQIDLARTHFEWVREHGTKSFIEYDIAFAELKRLASAPDK